MRKIFMMLVAAIMTFGSVGCANDDGNSVSNPKPTPQISLQDAIKGEWVESENIYLDKDKKEVEVLELNSRGCPNRMMNFRDQLVTETINDKMEPDSPCIEYKYRGKYTIVEDILNIEYGDYDAIMVERYEIEEITADKLVYLMEDYFVDGTLLGYFKIVFVRK
ncbi:lipocalin family protein [Myroides sp. WP-1]|uniref:lipocalin family protein n=1 Tax=Myroides sp. WP-1 TaxID=2759944 RepID=UPI0015FA4E17|nr:lipocalin family protein [Myroides sp. WP-1]MBB1140781.1 lipocalin family protein [Myroides sp. WP-1]